MMAFSRMLTSAAERVGIKVPPNPDDYNPNDYIRWHIFCICQLGQSMPYPGVHWDNAQVIADIPEDELKTITAQEILDRGFRTGFSK